MTDDDDVGVDDDDSDCDGDDDDDDGKNSRSRSRTNLPVGAPPADTWGFHEYSLNGEGLLIIDLYNK